MQGRGARPHGQAGALAGLSHVAAVGPQQRRVLLHCRRLLVDRVQQGRHLRPAALGHRRRVAHRVARVGPDATLATHGHIAVAAVQRKRLAVVAAADRLHGADVAVKAAGAHFRQRHDAVAAREFGARVGGGARLADVVLAVDTATLGDDAAAAVVARLR